MKYLIVNGDEFGLSEEVNRGIIEAHQKGILTSVSTIVTGKGFEGAVILAQHNSRLGVGIHLMLTDGFPASPPDEIESLISGEGRFFPRREFIHRYFKRKINAKEIEDELRAQVKKFKSIGLKPTHFDSHQSIYVIPGIFKMVLKIAREEDIPIRLPIDPFFLNKSFSFGFRSNIHVLKKIGMQGLAWRLRFLLRRSGVKSSEAFRTFFDFYYARKKSMEEELIRLVNGLPEGICEVMTHPGYCDEELVTWVYGKEEEASLREMELKALIADSVKKAVREREIRLINYSDLANHLC